MSRGIAPLPFAFMLAMAADAANGAAFEASNSSKSLELGALSGLLSAAIGSSSSWPFVNKELLKGHDGTKLVQFFPNFPNFRNCFAGAWRNC